MATKIWQGKFDPNGRYIALKVINLGRRIAHPGQYIPMDILGERRMRQLFDLRRIGPEPTDDAPAEEEAASTPIVEEEALPAEEDVWDIEEVSARWHYVTKNGERVSGALSPAEAEVQLHELRHAEVHGD